MGSQAGCVSPLSGWDRRMEFGEKHRRGRYVGKEAHKSTNGSSGVFSWILTSAPVSWNPKCGMTRSVQNRKSMNVIQFSNGDVINFHRFSGWKEYSSSFHSLEGRSLSQLSLAKKRVLARLLSCPEVRGRIPFLAHWGYWQIPGPWWYRTEVFVSRSVAGCSQLPEPLRAFLHLQSQQQQVKSV